MSNVFSLDALREEVDKEFSPFKIPLSDGTEVVLKSLLRLNEKARESVLKEVETLTGKSEDEDENGVGSTAKTATKILELVGDANVKKLIKEIDGDIPLLLHVIKSWMGATQLGEAESSPASSTSTVSTSSQISDSDTESTSETSS